MNFHQAMILSEEGTAVSRSSWDQHHSFVSYYKGLVNESLSLSDTRELGFPPSLVGTSLQVKPIYLKYVDKILTVYDPTHEDQQARDWKVYS